MVDVFISYKREERARCERIANKLRALGLNVWFDARLPSGKSFDREIESTLKQTKVVLVLWSPASVDSEWIRNEASEGKERGVLAAAQLAPCDLPIMFKSTHYETLYEPEFADDHPGWLKILERVAELTNRPGLVSYAKALGRAGEALQAWADIHPDDPLAPKAHVLIEELSGAPLRQPNARRGMGWAGALALAVLAAGAAGGAVWTYAGRVSTAATLPAPPPPALTPAQAAAQFVGAWGPIGAGERRCDDSARLEIGLSTGGLVVSGVAERLRGVVQGWLQTDGFGGQIYEYQRTEDGRLKLRAAGEESLQEFLPCASPAPL